VVGKMTLIWGIFTLNYLEESSILYILNKEGNIFARNNKNIRNIKDLQVT
jgi:hypothetical protein